MSIDATRNFCTRLINALKYSESTASAGTVIDLATQAQQAINESKHEGWSNQETWALALWIDNSSGVLDFVIATVKTHRKDLLVGAADALRTIFEPDDYPLSLQRGAHAALLKCAYDRVNWVELAIHYAAKLKDKENSK